MMPDAVTLSASIGRRRTRSERGVIRSIMSDVMDITIKSSKLKVQRSEKPVTDFQPAIAPVNDNMQLSFFQLNDPVLENIKDELQKTDINMLTPVEALMKLNEIRKMIGG